MRRLRQTASVVLGSIVLLAIAGGGAASMAGEWERYPWLSVSGGYENDRILQSGPDLFTVPGGNFFDVTPGVLFSRMVGERTRFNFDGQFTLEQFSNDDNRSLIGAGLNAELRRLVGSSWRWRLTAGGNYFTDSIQETVTRYQAGVETAFGLVGRRGFIELLLGGQGRRYPNLDSYDDAGIPGTYTELSASVGATGAIQPVGRLTLSGLVIGQSTDARDPVYDATSILAQAGARLAVAGPVWMYVSGLAQERRFSGRVTGEDTDTYRQIGAGLEILLGRNVDLTARYAVARYTDVLGASDDIYRFAIGVTWWPGGRGVRSLPAVISLDAGDLNESEIIREGEPHLFRLRAPEAVAVSLVADFNEWDPEKNPMQNVGGGWWQVQVPLPAGAYQYAFWVDGDLVTPPDAEITVEDGFGGRNGLLRIEPSSQ